MTASPTDATRSIQYSGRDCRVVRSDHLAKVSNQPGRRLSRGTLGVGPADADQRDDNVSDTDQ
jgi:hypothetical protein